MKNFTFLACFFTCVNAFAQPILTATDVRMVISSGTVIFAEGGLTFNGNTKVLHNGIINMLPSTITDNWSDATLTSSVLDNLGTGTVNMASDKVQTISGNTQFYNLYINNAAGITSTATATRVVSNVLQLNSGIVTNNTIIQVTNPALTSVQSNSAYLNSWVNGRLARITNIAGINYIFPIGKLAGATSYYAPLKLNKLNAASATYETEYFRATPIDRANFMTPPIDHISGLEYWHVQSSNFIDVANDDAKLSLSYRASSVVNSSQAVRDSLLVVQYTNTPQWQPTGSVGNFSDVTGDATFGYVTHREPVTGFDAVQQNFTLGSRSVFNVLPYQLLYWSATAKGNVAQLSWQVKAAQPIKHYTLQKSLNGVNYTTLQTVTSLAQLNATYNILDANPAIGISYYKLLVTDMLNNTYSAGVRKVSFSTIKPQLLLYPNPANNSLQVNLPSYNGQSVVQLYAANGTLISTATTNNEFVVLPISSLAAGVYTIITIQGLQKTSASFSKQ